jgi:hypothetical protein
MSKPFTVRTFNAGDVAPLDGVRRSTFTHLNERPPRSLIDVGGGYELFYPDRGADALVWDATRLDEHGRRIIHAWDSGADHGHPGTTPDGFVLSWWGMLDDDDEVAFVCSHLVNNAFGPIKRGERALRLKLWWQGWAAMRAEKRRLTAAGYRVFKLGDFNRRPRWWPGIMRRSIGSGYDRIIWPPAAQLLGAWRGEPNGSDHLPLIGQFRITR